MPLAIVTTIPETRAAIRAARSQGLSIGLVPTMGALHAGHRALIHQAREETGYVVVSIFVNPTQFGPREDLARYPRPFEKDIEACSQEGTDLVFHPSPQVVYPPSFRTWVEVHDLQDRWEGATRPGHFRGVATVVLKLFNIVQPDIAYFGQKDAQQVRILQQMVRDLDVPLILKVCPTVREADGLALSSRNQYLDPEQRQAATVLFRSLEEIQARVGGGEKDVPSLHRLVEDRVNATPGARLDYAAFVHSDTLLPMERLEGTVLVALAVYVGTTRLIDNILLTT